MAKHLNLVSYFGGKYPQLKWLLPHFPAGNFHFIDLMCGSGNVALNVEYPLITVNDLNENIVNLFWVLRDQYEEFVRQLYFSPFARRELERVLSDETTDPVRKAVNYFIRCQLGYGANGSQNNHKGFGTEYKIGKSNHYRVDNWNNKLKKLPAVVEKLRSFQIEHTNALELFSKVNKSCCITYFDPPYVLKTRSSKKRYTHEVEDDFHRDLSDTVYNANSLVAISGYESTLYDDLFTKRGFHKFTGKPNRSNVKKEFRTECLFTNYHPSDFSTNPLFKSFFNTIHNQHQL